MHILVDGARLKTYKTTVPKATEDDPDPDPDPITAIQLDMTDMDATDLAALHRLMRSPGLTLVLATTQLELGEVLADMPSRRGRVAGRQAGSLKDRIGDELEAAGLTVERNAVISVGGDG